MLVAKWMVKWNGNGSSTKPHELQFASWSGILIEYLCAKTWHILANQFELSLPFILRHPCRTIFKDIQFQLIREQENIFPQKPRIIYLIFILNPTTFPLPCSLGRRITFYTSVFIGVAGRILTMITSDNYVLFSISAVLGSLTSISIFQAPLIIAMETSEP